MRHVDPPVLRLLERLSSLLGKRLELHDGTRDSQGPPWPQITEWPIQVQAADGTPLSLDERAVVDEILATAARERMLRSEVQSLDHRLRLLERENLDLVTKNRALVEAASLDSLTGLYARSYLMNKIDAELNRALRHGTPVSLLMIDIDHFKRVNDNHGHQAGDQVLQSLGHLLRDSCRVYDMPGRYGGEEFCLLLPETPTENTLQVAERIRRRVALTPMQLASESIHITASIGVAGVESSDSGVFDSASLIERADRALYSAKDRGRNRVESWNQVLSGARKAPQQQH